jgi:hypothetical protein
MPDKRRKVEEREAQREQREAKDDQADGRS